MKMIKIVQFFINRPLVVNLIAIGVFLFGIKSTYEIRKDAFPEISLNKIFIQTIYPGASVRDVELNVTVLLEDALGEVEGIDEVISVSQEGISLITIMADEDATEKRFREIVDQVDDAVRSINDLPTEIEGQPSISTFTSKDIPILEIAFNGKRDNLKGIIPYLEKKLKKVPGVAYVDTIGLPDDELHILVDPAKARSKSIGLRQIASSVQKRNLQGSGGTLESFIGEKKIVSYNKYESNKDILNTYLRISDLGYHVQLKDVATIKTVPQDTRLFVRNNGQEGVIMYLKKDQSADILKTSDGVYSVLSSEKLPDGVTWKILNDASRLTRDRLNLITSNAAMGFLLVSIILFLIFNARTALWTAFGIPFSLFASIVVLDTYDLTLNLISLGGFIIVLGMLVDDAIVIAEQINTNMENGMEGKTAALEAVKVMWKPVLGSSLTTMVAFSPAMAIGGFPGKFVWIIPLMVVIALSISLFESYFILPAHLSHSKKKGQSPKASLNPKKKFIVIVLENFYRWVLTSALKIKYIILSVFIVTFIISILTMRFIIPRDPFPQDAAEAFTIQITYPEGFSRKKTIEELDKVEKILNTLPSNELTGFSSRIGTLNESSLTKRGSQDNLAITFVYLSPFSQRDRTVFEIMSHLRSKFKPILEKTKAEYSINLVRFGPPLGRDLEIRLSGKNEDDVMEIMKDIKTFLSKINGVTDISDNLIRGKNELNIEMRYDLIAVTGLTVEDILSSIRIAFDGMIVSSINLPDQILDFRLRLNHKGRAHEEYIKELPVSNPYGQIINLREMIRLEEKESKGEINHINGSRAVSVFINVDPKKMTPLEVFAEVQKNFHSNEKVTIDYAGMPVETEKIFKDLGSAGLTAVIGIFIIISLIFNSLKKPFIILATMPFALVGVVFSLVTHGLPMSTLVGVSLMGLLGVIVNDSIVMVDTIDRIVKEKSTGISLDIIIEGAVSRIRPILLTTITTIFGLFPTAYGIGGYDPFLSDMCLTMAFGLIFASIFILFLIPIYYSIGLDIAKIQWNTIGEKLNSLHYRKK